MRAEHRHENHCRAQGDAQALRRLGSIGCCAAVGPYSTGVSDVPEASRAVVDPPVSVRTVDIDWRSLVAVFAVFLCLVAAQALLHEIPRTLTALTVALIVALALNPLVQAVERRLHVDRVLAVSFVLSGFAIAVVLLGLLLVPPAVQEARQLGQQLHGRP